MKINLLKSIVVGIKLDKEWENRIAREIGCEIGSWPMSYLGLSLGGNPCHLSFWEPVIERVAKRLDGWNWNCLSKGGMLTLVSSVLDIIPIFFLSKFKLQKRVASINEVLFVGGVQGRHKRSFSQLG